MRYVSEGIQTMIWTDADVTAPHLSVTVAVMTGCMASLPCVEIHTVADGPEAMAPWVLDVQRTVVASPSGSAGTALRAM